MDQLSPGGGDFDLVAASIRADAGDQRTFLDVLAAKLQDALPGHVTVQREGGLFAREHRVRQVVCTVNQRRYELEWKGGAIEARMGAAGNPRLVQPMVLDQLVELLSRDLVAEARASNSARAAMDALVEGRLPADQIVRPAEAGAAIVYRRPPGRVALTAVLVVGNDEVGVLVQGDHVLGPVPAGRHELSTLGLEAGELTVLAENQEVDVAIYLVATRELPGLKFGGMVDKVLDPATGLAVGLRVFGDYGVRVADARVLANSLGAAAEPIDNDRLNVLMRSLLMKVLREDVVTHITEQGWPILGLAAHTQAIEDETMKKVQILAQGYGLVVTRMGNFTISMKDEDEALLTARRARMAEASGPAPAAGAAQVRCGSCATANPAAARFCISCGHPLSNRCPKCGTDNPSPARFCLSCGTALEAAAAKGSPDA